MPLALVLIMRVFMTFDPSPDPTVTGYRCMAFEIHITQEACPDDPNMLCDATSPPTWIDCHVTSVSGQPFRYMATALDPAPGQAIFGCIMSVDEHGHTGACVTQEIWP
jgi:hypothetical protein